MFANNQSGATSYAFFDICNVITAAGTVPTPYVNMAVSSVAVPNCVTVYVGGSFAHNISTTTTVTSGDETGTGLGVTSGTFIGSSQHLTSSAKTYFSCMPATRMLDSTMQNSTNSFGTTLTPAQCNVLVLS